MGGEKVIGQVPDLLQIKFRCRVRVHHGGVVDVFAIFSHQCTDGEFLHIDVGADECCELWRQFTNIGGLDATVIDEARNFSCR